MTREDKEFKKRYEDLLAKSNTALATMQNGSDKSSTSGAERPRADRRKEAEKVEFPDLPTVPGYAIWLEAVLRIVMDGSGAPMDALVWWAEVKSKTVEQLADSGKFVRWDLKIGTALLKRAKGHLRQNLFLRQLKADSVNDILRGRQIMKLIMLKYKAEDHAQRYYDIADLNAVKCVKDDIVGFLLRWDTVFLRMIPEAQTAYGERALLHIFYEQIKDSAKLKHDMWVFRKTKEKDAEMYKRVHCIEWLREQIEDWENEQIRRAVRTGALEGIQDGTDVPGGDGSGFLHIAAPARAGGKKTKAQKKQSAQDKAKHAADAEALVAAGPKGRGKGKGKGKAEGPVDGKAPPPKGVCFEFWTHGKCARRESETGCIFDHVRATHPSAPAYIKADAAARAKPRPKAKAKGKGATPAKGSGQPQDVQKPKGQTPCRFNLKGECKKGKDCDFLHEKGPAAPATDSKKEKRKERKKRKKAAAGAVEVNASAVGLALSDSDSS